MSIRTSGASFFAGSACISSMNSTTGRERLCSDGSLSMLPNPALTPPTSIIRLRSPPFAASSSAIALWVGPMRQQSIHECGLADARSAGDQDGAAHRWLADTLLLLQGDIPGAVRDEVDFRFAADKELGEFTVLRTGKALQPAHVGPMVHSGHFGRFASVECNDALHIDTRRR